MKNTATLKAGGIEYDGNISLANRAVYYWDLYLLYRNDDDLVAASAFMGDYVKSGGTSFLNLESCIKSIIEKLQN